jgi:titin
LFNINSGISRFTIRVNGHPPPEITWYKDGSKVVSSPDFEIVQEGDMHSLYIPEVFYEDAGKYTAEAKNPAGQTQCTANLRIEGIIFIDLI